MAEPAGAAAPIIEVENLVYEYATTRALDGVTLSVVPGTITALVGPNGAGKTTLLKCLAALEMPYSGRVRIAGLDTREHPRRIHAKLGYLPDFFGLYEELSVERCLTYAALSHGIGADAVDAAVKRTASQVGLANRLGDRASELSRGLRQRLAIGQAIVHAPAVLLLDEPASGLDPQARRDLSHLLLALRDDGMTLVVSSHILAELEDYSQAMIIIEQGQITRGGVLSVGRGAAALARITLAVPNEGLRAFLEAEGIKVVEADASSALIELADDPMVRAALLRRLIGAGFEVSEIARAARSLEETYFEEVQRSRAK